jgi:DNA-binding response OmpR family regulator
MHNGEMLIDSQSRPMAAPVAPSRFGVKVKEETGTFRCLVVDDNTVIMRLVAQMLEAVGYQVDTAQNGSRALSKASACRYDLVVTDLDMPKVDGYSLAFGIKRGFRDTKTVIMTGRCQAEVFDLMTTAVADAWIFKPFGFDELLHTLDDLGLPTSLLTEAP